VTTITPDFAYISGIYEGVHSGEGKEGYIFDIESESKEFLEKSLVPRLTELLGTPVRIKEGSTIGQYRIRFWNQKLIESLLPFKETPKKVLKWKNELKLLWVRGFFDAEGSPTKTVKNEPMLSLYNSDIEKLKIIEKILKRYKIVAKYYEIADRTHQYFSGRENLQKFLETVKLENPGKTYKLQLYLQEL